MKTLTALITAVFLTLTMSANAGNIDPTDEWNVYSDSDPVTWADDCYDYNTEEQE